MKIELIKIVCIVTILLTLQIQAEEILFDATNRFGNAGGHHLSLRNDILHQEIRRRDSRFFISGISIDSKRFSMVEIVYRAEGISSPTTGQLYFAQVGSPINGNHFFRMPSLKADGQWHTITLDASKNRRDITDSSAWFRATAPINQIRVDMLDQGPGGWVEIRSIRFFDSDPGSSASTDHSRKTTLHLVGDSTMCNYPGIDSKLAGWGQLLPLFASPKITITNHACSGAGIRSFLRSGHWNRLLDAIRPGDVVVLQFGINDSNQKDTKNYADLELFTQLFRLLIQEVRSAGATPLAATVLPAYLFDRNGKFIQNRQEYNAAIRRAAAQEKTLLIDLYNLTAAKLDAVGAQEAEAFYILNKLSPAPEKRDPTHLTSAGAKLIAGLFSYAISNEKLSISSAFGKK